MPRSNYVCSSSETWTFSTPARLIRTTLRCSKTNKIWILSNFRISQTTYNPCWIIAFRICQMRRHTLVCAKCVILIAIGPLWQQLEKRLSILVKMACQAKVWSFVFSRSTDSPICNTFRSFSPWRASTKPRSGMPRRTKSGSMWAKICKLRVRI